MSSSASQGSHRPVPFVLLLIDFMNLLDFPGADDLREPAVAAARAAAVLRRRVIAAGGRVIFANDNSGLWQYEFRQHRRRCLLRGGASAQLARRLTPERGDIAVLKPRHSAFFATPLDLILQGLDCRRLILAGLAADNCILFTAMNAYVHGYELWVPADCIAAESKRAKLQALQYMRRVLKAETRNALESD